MQNDDKLKEKQLILMFEEQKNKAIGTLAAGVAHEVNNPLMIALGYLSMLADKPEISASEENLELIELQKKALLRIKDVVTSLRTYARADTQYLENTDVHKCVVSTVDLIKSIYIGTAISLNLNLNASKTFIKGNIGKFQRGLLNIISNAKDAILAKGSGCIGITSRNDGDKLILTIKDNGVGVSEENLSRIFEPFYSTKPTGQGSGLGLSQAKAYFESMNAKISATSVKGEGTEITITFDVSEDVVRDKKVKVLSAEKGKVLIVDDEEQIRIFLRSILERDGYEVDDCDDGDIALEKLKHDKFNFLVMDLNMPRMRGDVLLKELAKLNVGDVKILVITAGIVTDFSEEERAVIKKIACGYITKPFSKNDILQILNDLR